MNTNPQSSPINRCISCGADSLIKQMELQDYFMSHEQFALYYCAHCGLMVTWPQPNAESLPAYYKSKKYFSHKQKELSFTGIIYKAARRVMVGRKVKIINKKAEKGLLVDIGCGTGEFLAESKKRGWKALGIEPDEQARFAATHEHALQVFDTPYLDQIEPGTVDVVTMWHSLEHTINPKQYLKAIGKMLKINGLLLIALPNYLSWDAHLYGKFWAAWDVPRHLFHFSRQAIITMVEKQEFEVVEILPLPLDAFYVCLLSEKYKKRKGSYLKAIINGFLSNRKARTQKCGHSSQIYLFRKK